MTRQRAIAILKYVLFLGAGIGLFYVAVKDIDMNRLLDGLASLNYFYVALTVVMLMFSHFFRAARWQMLMKASGHDVPLSSTFASVLVGYGFNTIVPRGGEFARCTVLTRAEGVPFATGFGTVITERLSDVLVLGMLFLGVFFAEYDKIGEIWNEMGAAASTTPQQGMSLTRIIMLCMAGAFVLGVILFFLFRKKIVTTSLWAKVAGFGKTFREALVSIFKLDKPWLFLLHTAGIWVSYLLMAYLPLLALKETSHLTFYFSFIVLVIGAIGFVFPSPGGTGSYHYLVEKTFQIFHGMGPSGAVYAIIAHAFQFVLTVLTGVIAWVWIERRIAAKKSQNG